MESVHYKDECASNCLHYVLHFAPEIVKEQSVGGWLPLHVALQYNKASYYF